MANNYTQCAELLELPLEAAQYAVALDNECRLLWERNNFPSDGDIETGTTDERIKLDAAAILEDCEGITSATFEAGARGLYISAEESGDMESIAAVVQAAMARFDVPGAVSLSFAWTCSKMRAGEFGGGAVVITKDDERWMTTGQWVQDTINELTKENAG